MKKELSTHRLARDIERLKKQQVKDYNKLWLMINSLKKKLKKKK